MLDFKIRFVKEKPSLKDYNELFENIYDEKIDEKILEEAFNNILELWNQPLIEVTYERTQIIRPKVFSILHLYLL